MQAGLRVIGLFLIITLLIVSCKNKKKLSSTKPKAKPKTEITTAQQQILNKYSTQIGESVHNLTLYQFIDRTYGTPHKSKNPTGYDCSSYVSALYRNVYALFINGTSANMAKQSRPVAKQDLQEGDLVFFKINQSAISHVGVYLTNNKFVHASTSKGVMISDLNEVYWAKYYAQGGKMK